MRRHTMWVLVSVAVILTPLDGDAQRSEGHLTYEGKPLAFWQEALTGSDSSQHKKAVEALLRVGPAEEVAVPAFAAVIDHPDLFVRTAAVRGLCQIKPKSGQGARRQSRPSPRSLRRLPATPMVWGAQRPPLRSAGSGGMTPRGPPRSSSASRTAASPCGSGDARRARAGGPGGA